MPQFVIQATLKDWSLLGLVYGSVLCVATWFIHQIPPVQPSAQPAHITTAPENSLLCSLGMALYFTSCLFSWIICWGIVFFCIQAERTATATRVGKHQQPRRSATKRYLGLIPYYTCDYELADDHGLEKIPPS